MACNSCAKPFTLLRKDRGCPNCGFSYCSKCLQHSIFLPKLNATKKVCTKCSSTLTSLNKSDPLQPPDVYYKRIGMTSNENSNINNEVEQEIMRRLKSLKDDKSITAEAAASDKIEEKLQKLKGVQPTTSDAELQLRLANLRGVPVIDTQTKFTAFTPDLRTEQEQADDLLKGYLEQAQIDKKYKDGFDKNIENIESRVLKLKGQTADECIRKLEVDSDSDEEKEIAKLIEKVKVESSLSTEDNISSTVQNEELPFCEICNEDAKMRCLGCRYLFCKTCFMEHRDDDYECNKYVPYDSTKT